MRKPSHINTKSSTLHQFRLLRKKFKSFVTLLLNVSKNWRTLRPQYAISSKRDEPAQNCRCIKYRGRRDQDTNERWPSVRYREPGQQPTGQPAELLNTASGHTYRRTNGTYTGAQTVNHWIEGRHITPPPLPRL